MGRETTPSDLRITPRDRRFGRGDRTERWWNGGDPVATALYNALSATFPKGEAFFVESVKRFRDGANPKLAGEIRAFVSQEVAHSREHVAFNKRAHEAGYDLSGLEARVDWRLDLVRSKPPIASLAATMALEHFTAILAHELLRDPRHLGGADAESAALWRWHSVEEIEHKGVAFDTWNHATRGWTPWKRWKVRSLMMLIVTGRFFRNRWEDSMNLLAQDGITGWKARWGLFRYLAWSPGVVRRIFPAWLAYFKPGFHPWDHDDRDLIRKYEGDFAAALMPAE